MDVYKNLTKHQTINRNKISIHSMYFHSISAEHSFSSDKIELQSLFVCFLRLNEFNRPELVFNNGGNPIRSVVTAINRTSKAKVTAKGRIISGEELSPVRRKT